MQAAQQVSHLVAHLALGAAQHENELVAAKAAHPVRRVQLLQKTRGGLLQQQVAHGMAEAVVHLLEAIDVQHQHSQTIALENGIGQLLLEQHAVGQAGDGVVVGQPLKLRLGAAQFSIALLQLALLAVDQGQEQAGQARTGQGEPEQR
ncbi:hypothetical protein D3C79_894730 [compost metagenome]